MAEFPGEFEFIARLLKPLAGHEAALGLADDAAILEPSPAKSLVLTKDMLVEGVHYLAGDPPGDIAAKALRVNLSDLAAMGATPVAYLMGISRNERQGLSWMEQFVEGLARDQATFGLSLIGGDTTATPGPMTISITALGEVPSGRALRRNGAQPGDVVLVSGTIGDACLGLGVARGEIEGDADGFLLGRYRLPTPRLPLAPLLSRYAHAAIDVSDGLVADLGHIAEESGMRAVIEAARVPLSPPAKALVDARPGLIADLITGGDDYELLLTTPRNMADDLILAAADLHIPLTPIGHIEGGRGVAVLQSDGKEMALARPGYMHF